MEARKFVADLRRRGLRVWAEGDDLFVDPATTLTVSNVTTIQVHKPAVVAYFESETATTPTMPTEPAGNGEAPAVASVSAAPLAESPRKRRDGFTVDLTGVAECPHGFRARLPGNRDYLFWEFWTGQQLSALARSMREDAHLNWFARGVVQVASPDGRVRHLRWVGGIGEWRADEATLPMPRRASPSRSSIR